MKNIFKKNQIIITALCIMIAIAGYLNFAGKNDEDKVADVGNEVLDYESYSETADDDITEGDTVSVEGVDVLDITNGLLNEDLDVADTGEDVNGTDVADISDEDMDSEEVAQYEVSDNGEIIVDDETAKANDNTEVADGEKADDTEVADGEKADSTKVADAEKTDSQEVADAEDTSSKDDQETSAPGEAILVSTILEPDFFSNAKLEREQNRALRKETLLDIINNESMSENLKQDAVDKLINLQAIVDKEDKTERLLQAKGFSDAVVSINPDGGNVDVIINSDSVTEQDIAQVEDIVKRQTGVESSEIVISAVVADE